jgi:hypothetical protein
MKTQNDSTKKKTAKINKRRIVHWGGYVLGHATTAKGALRLLHKMNASIVRAGISDGHWVAMY